MSTTETKTISCIAYCNNPAHCYAVVVSCTPITIDIPSDTTSIIIDRSSTAYPRSLSFNTFRRIGNRNFYTSINDVSIGSTATLNLNNLQFERQDIEKLEILQAITYFEARNISIFDYINSYASGCVADTICEKEAARLRLYSGETLQKEYLINTRAIILSTVVAHHATYFSTGTSVRYIIPAIISDKIDRIIIRKGFCNESGDIKLYIKLIYTDNSSEYYIIDEQHDTAIIVKKPLQSYALLSSLSTATGTAYTCYVADILLVPKPF
jgi:hypothetical protein